MSHQLEDDLKVVHLKVMPFFYGFCLMNGTTDARSFFLLLVRLDVAAQKINRQESSESLVLELKKVQFKLWQVILAGHASYMEYRIVPIPKI